MRKGLNAEEVLVEIVQDNLLVPQLSHLCHSVVMV